MTDGRGDDAFRTHWLVLGLPSLFDDVEVTDLAPLTVHVHTGDQPATLEISDTGLAMETGTPTTPDLVVIQGEPDDVFAVLTGTANAPADVEIQGPRDAIRRLHVLASRSRLAPRTG